MPSPSCHKRFNAQAPLLAARVGLSCRPLARAAAIVTVASVTVAAQRMAAQNGPATLPDSLSRWEVHAEVAVVTGGTWADGGNAPTVRGGSGALFGVQLVRALNAHAPAARMRLMGGMAGRVHARPLTLQEGGERWDGGTLTQGDLMAVLAWRSLGTAGVRLGADAGVGFAYLSSSNRIAPFAGAAAFAPMGEVTVVLSPGRATMERRPYAAFVRVGATRFAPSATPGDAPDNASAGFVTQLAIGLRVGR